MAAARHYFGVPCMVLSRECPLNGMDCLHKHPMSQFQQNRQLIRDAEFYEENFLGGENKFAAMVRIERIKGTYFNLENME